MITFENCDCMEALRKFPDKFFDADAPTIIEAEEGEGNEHID